MRNIFKRQNSYPPGILIGTNGYSRPVGPGGGYGWGGGPRAFVGPTRPQQTHVELGQDEDFPEGGDEWGPCEGDLGFPHASRWPGWPRQWETPFFSSGGGFGGFSMGRVSTVFACTDLIARTLATMSLRVVRGNVPVLPPAWTSNPEPTIYTSMVEAMQGIVNSLLHRGQAFLVPTAREADFRIARWVVVNPDAVTVEPDELGLPTYRIGNMPIDRYDILHLRYQTWPGSIVGIGPLDACARNLASASALEQWGMELAVNNGIPTAVLSSAVKLTGKQARDVKLSWAEAAMSRGTLPAVLSGGLTYQPLNLKPSDIGLLDLRTFDEARIASSFGVPLWLVGLPVNDGLTYSTVEDTFDYFWRATLRPIAYNIAMAISGWALPIGETLRFASEQLTEPSIADRIHLYLDMIQGGMLTVEEARIMEHMPPLPNVSPSPELSGMRNEGV